MVQSTCKTVAVVIGILGAIGSIIAGISSESFVVFLLTLISVGISSLFLYAIGEIVYGLEVANVNLCDVCDRLSEIKKEIKKDA